VLREPLLVAGQEGLADGGQHAGYQEWSDEAAEEGEHHPHARPWGPLCQEDSLVTCV